MDKPRLLDLFCGAGGAAMGYHRAGFIPYGIDNRPQPHYPFPFLQMDALEAMDRLLSGEGLTFNNGETLYLADFAAFHASPPCQGYSIMHNLPWLKKIAYPLLISDTRVLLKGTGKPYVIENVMGAQKKANMQAAWLCGGMFGLPFYRHRLFETSFFWMQPGHPNHQIPILSGGMLKGRARTVIYKRPDASSSTLCRTTGSHRSKSEFLSTCEGMKIDWMVRDEISQAIPPAYTEFIGKYLMKVERLHKATLHAYGVAVTAGAIDGI